MEAEVGRLELVTTEGRYLICHNCCMKDRGLKKMLFQAFTDDIKESKCE